MKTLVFNGDTLTADSIIIFNPSFGSGTAILERFFTISPNSTPENNHLQECVLEVTVSFTHNCPCRNIPNKNGTAKQKGKEA